MLTTLISVILLLLLSETAAQDTCLPLWPRIQYGSVYSDSSASEKIYIKFNTRSQCPRSYVVVTYANSTIRKISCQKISIKCSEKMNSYQTFVQRCSISQINFQQNFTYLPYGSNSTSGSAIPFSPEPLSTSIIHPNVNFHIIQSTDTSRFIVLADWSQLHVKIGTYKSVNESIDLLRNSFGTDGIIVNGDIAYDMDSNNGTNYEEFLNMLSRSGRFVPVLMIAGNHEHNSDDDELLFYSTFEQYGADQIFASGLGVGPAFIATFDPFVDVYNMTTLRNLRSEIKPALQGFTQAMQNASKSNKIIIPISHYPLKCSAKAQNCQNDSVKLKSYFDLMFENNIKFYIGAHYHTYERLYPYCKNGTFSLIPPPYSSASLKDCMVSIVEGIAGNDDKIVEVYKVVNDYTAKLSFNKTGVGLLTVSPVQVKFQHFSSDNILTLQDEFTINYEPKEQMELIQQ